MKRITLYDYIKDPHLTKKIKYKDKSLIIKCYYDKKIIEYQFYDEYLYFDIKKEIEFFLKKKR